MIDVSGKLTTRRRAQARGRIRLSPAAFEAVKTGTNPKGNVLALAEVAGIMAAKKTSDLIPLCHPLPLQSVRLGFELGSAASGGPASTIDVWCEVVTEAQTGVEMEALCGVNGALLSIYDLSKAVDPAITIEGIRLEVKEGGKSGRWTHPESMANLGANLGAKLGAKLGAEQMAEVTAQPLTGIRVGLITISDRGFAGETQDRSGPAIRAQLEQWGASTVVHPIVADEKRKIQSAIHTLIEEHHVPLIITTGGTGLSERDVTPEAIEEVCDRLIPGIGELLRQSGSHHIETAWLSRSLGAQLGKTWIIALPGSVNAVREGLPALLPLISHGVEIAHGGKHSK
jgi:molybdenum cofactor biosynthesis protein MoaC